MFFGKSSLTFICLGYIFIKKLFAMSKNNIHNRLLLTTEEIHMRLKLLSVQRKMPIQKLVTKILEEYLNDNEKK